MPEWQANPRVKHMRREHDFTKGKRGSTGLETWEAFVTSTP